MPRLEKRNYCASGADNTLPEQFNFIVADFKTGDSL